MGAAAAEIYRCRAASSYTERMRVVTAALIAAAAACGGGGGGGGDGGEAPDAPPPDAIAAVCGNGVVELGEACDDGVNDRLGGGCRPGCTALDDSDELFARPLHEIVIDLAPADWDLLRRETKSRHVAFLGADCRTHPVVSPYSWYLGEVRIDGDLIPMVGLRKKGHLGSQSTLRPSIKLDFDRAVAGRRYHGLDRLALNNNKQDASLARTCVAYQVFAAAGLPAPRCTHAHVTVDGEDLGVYTLSEEVEGDFLARRFADPSGNLYEGTASDFRPEFIGGFERENNASSPSRADLDAVLTALTTATSDDALVAALDGLVDLDEFFRFWAAETLVWHRDGYTGNANNFFLYADPGDGGRFHFLPWGADATLSPDNRATVPDSVMAFGALANRLYAIPAQRDRYYAALDELLATAWDPPALIARVDAIGAAADTVLSPAAAAARATAADAVKTTITGRAAAIAAARAGGPPAWTDPMRSLPCRIAVGTARATFSTTWGTLAADAFASGTGSFVFEAGAPPVTTTRTGARAGVTTTGAQRLNVIGETATRRYTVTVPYPDPVWFLPFTILGPQALVSPPHGITVVEADLTVNPVRNLRTLELGEGTWTFTAAGTTAGAAVTGSFDGMLFVASP